MHRDPFDSNRAALIYVQASLMMGALGAMGALATANASLAVNGARALAAVLCGGASIYIGLTSDWKRPSRWAAWLLFLTTLFITLARAREGWPVQANYLPLAICFGSVIWTPRVGWIMTAMSVLTVPVVALGGRPSAGVGQHLGLWLSIVIIFQAFIARFMALLTEGARELVASGETLEASQAAIEAVSERLSARLSEAVEELGAALALPSTESWSESVRPQPAEEKLRNVLDALSASRAALPQEPHIVAPTLEARIHLFRLRARHYCYLALLAVFGSHCVRYTIMAMQPHLGLSLTCLAILIVFGIVVRIRPAWRERLETPLWAIVCLLSAPMLSLWVLRSHSLPPNLIIWGAAAVCGAACFGTGLAMSILLLGALATFPALAFADLPLVLPVPFFIAYGTASILFGQWPRHFLERIQVRRDTAHEKIRHLRRLITTLFHDLSNPLQVVAMALQDEGPLSPTDRAQLLSMVARMQSTLNAALRGPISLHPVSADRLWSDVVQLFVDRFASKGITVKQLDPSNATVLADETLLRDSVLANLVSNALKFSPSGGTIELRTISEADQVRLVVEDRGPGIPQEVTAALLGDAPVPSRRGSNGEGGSGFGLLLARDYVRAMGGDLLLLSRPGGGVSAQVLLPTTK